MVTMSVQIFIYLCFEIIRIYQTFNPYLMDKFYIFSISEEVFFFFFSVPLPHLRRRGKSCNILILLPKKNKKRNPYLIVISYYKVVKLGGFIE